MTTEPDQVALAATGLDKRFRRTWALRDCSFTLPAGRVCGLVGPNGAGKSTLLSLAAGLRVPNSGTLEVLGEPRRRLGIHPQVAILTQDKPLYRSFKVAEMLRAASEMNREFDSEYAARLVAEAAVPADSKIGALSGGQRTRVALAIALARRPRLLLLDEPLSDLDPLARREIMRTLLSEVADSGATVILSSHVVAELEDVCDHLIVLRDGQVRLAGDIDELLAEHHFLTGPADQELDLSEAAIVERSSLGRQQRLLVRGPVTAPDGWDHDPPNLEEMVLAQLRVATEVAA